MIQKLPIKLLMLALFVALAWWVLMPGDSPELVSDTAEKNSETGQLVSAIQPMSDADANGTIGVISGSFEPPLILNNKQNVRLNALFERALTSDTPKQAIQRYKSIIEEFPSAIEPHLNLASLYANNGDLEAAREVLMHGFEYNPRAHLLFSSLQKLHGALAAAAYSKAVNTTSGELRKVVLPSATNLLTAPDQESQIEALRTKIATLDSLASRQNESAIDTPAMTILTSELSSLKGELRLLKQTHIQELTDLNNSLSAANESLLGSQAAEREALARVVRAEQGVNDQLTQGQATAKELAAQESAGIVESLEQEVSSLRMRLADAQQAADASNVTTAVDTTAAAIVSPSADSSEVAVSTTATVIEQQKASAINLVKSWAKSWSAQDVAAYVSHYADNYSSSSSLTRKQWLAQRQLRLTNKVFINVSVSNFQVADLRDRFSVTFSQNYKSNTVDDTVVKRLIFQKQADDWSKAKITNERIVSR